MGTGVKKKKKAKQTNKKPLFCFVLFLVVIFSHIFLRKNKEQNTPAEFLLRWYRGAVILLNILTSFRLMSNCKLQCAQRVSVCLKEWTLRSTICENYPRKFGLTLSERSELIHIYDQSCEELQ